MRKLFSKVFFLAFALAFLLNTISCQGGSKTMASSSESGAANASTNATSKQNPVVKMVTSMGEVEIELYPDKAPITVANFLTYVNEKFYDGTIFHRVIPDFMIQGGGFEPGLQEKESKHAPIENEAGNGLKNEEGTIAMARTNVVNSATAQFFINTKNNTFLNHRNESPQGFGYAVFGKVISGLDVVHKIEHVKTGTVGMYENVPDENVTIESIRVK